jgi:WD40 repeat protein
LVFGWKHLKEFRYCNFLSKKTNYYSNFQYIQHYLQRIPEKFFKEKVEYLSQKPVIKNAKTLKTIYEITATAISRPDQQYLATGMANGVISIWSTSTLNIKMNTDKQQGEITCLKFFEGWKLVSGSSKGEVFIDNVLDLRNEVKRTNVFEAKIDYPISNINVSELGLAFVLDSNANLRVYDLWRNEKISKLYSCNNFAML